MLSIIHIEERQMASLLRNISMCAVFVFLLIAPSAWACSCAPIGSNPPCQAAWGVSAVFTGTVTDITEPSPISPPPRGSGATTGRRLANEPNPSLPPRNRVVHMQLGEAFFGVPNESKEIEIITGLGGGDCGYGFQVGTAYVVYAYKNSEGQLGTGICSRTRPVADAAEDLAYLRSIATAPSTGEIRIVRARLDTKAVSGVHINV